MDEFLGFVDEIGRTIDGKHIYRFDFTLDTETIWGEYFNVTPSAIIPDLQPDKNALSIQAKLLMVKRLFSVHSPQILIRELTVLSRLVLSMVQILSNGFQHTDLHTIASLHIHV